MYISMNGELMAPEEARLSPFEHGYMYGLGVFETLRVYKGYPFLYKDHLKRLSEGIKEIGIDTEITEQYFYEEIERVVKANEWLDAYVRFNVSAGEGPLGLPVESYTDPQTIIYTKPLQEKAMPVEKQAVTLTLRRNSPEGDIRLKSHHFLNNILGKKELKNRADVEGIFLTDEGHVAEGIVSNIFWVKNGELYTPTINTGILNGVTRQYILRLANELNIPVHEGYFSKEELQAADMAFITNSIQEIVPLSAVDDISYESPATSLIAELQAEYKRHRFYLSSYKELTGKKGNANDMEK
ncbi:aminodeoxychorismate lyase [Salsuginibacillus kocurii]|uniref:aminodeoxychorismate lyase n=1 Tax=Salsuginibacillus kocurii TaxID=427078 RepID=UPI00035DCB1D|nr:aminodeoxychorismate lyase [Salsuginibacillus kocurii]